MYIIGYYVEKIWYNSIILSFRDIITGGKNMRKLGKMFLLGVLMTTLLSGCGSDDAKDGQVTIKVWESLEVKDYIEAAGAAYHELHPEVNIVYENVELNSAVPRLILDGPAGAGADLFAAPCDKLGEAVEGGYVLPVTNQDAVSGRVMESCLKAATYKDLIYGYPVSDETYALYYNKDEIDITQVPTTWDAMLAYEQYNSHDGHYGFVMDPTTGYYTIIFTTAGGNRLFGEDGTDNTKTYLNTSEAVSGLSFLGDLSKALGISSSDISTQIADDLFMSGKADMTISGPWNTSVFEEAGINFGVTTLPRLPGEATPAASFSGARLMMVSSYSEHQKEAADFAEFLLTDEMQQLRYEYLKCIPSVAVDVEDEAIEGFMSQLQYATPMPSIPSMTAFWDAMSSASKNIWDGADVQKTMDNCDLVILKASEQ